MTTYHYSTKFTFINHSILLTLLCSRCFSPHSFDEKTKASKHVSSHSAKWQNLDLSLIALLIFLSCYLMFQSMRSVQFWKRYSEMFQNNFLINYCHFTYLGAMCYKTGLKWWACLLLHHVLCYSVHSINIYWKVTIYEDF